MTTVVLVDDQDLVRAGLRTLLTHDGSIEVVAEATDGRRGVEVVRRHRPDVVLMDLRMPVLDGIEATRLIRDDVRLGGTNVVVLTTFDDDTDIVEAIRAGAIGYLLKNTPRDDLRDAVARAGRGERLLSPAITGRLMQLVAEGQRVAEPDPRLRRLSERELEVLARIGHGDSNDEIAAALHLSPATARTYVSRILAKLGARDRPELVVVAHRSGLVAP
ncbi:response regulator transcription factor [Agromyces aerolatus]|uniref:response regulator transcription factor n=1 Tax=Agromyces sp. LY-1074 TaxID=3074080 RepID=UPI00285C34F5|nr:MULTISPECIES: response regulator transcription factor [unclassified Agromyces]MDR5700165.1 response regulator transcription factor [Agromyces sp. LY-1074]MDR5706467.1 response regulator transcription factor [Agromyces sp. LY-1358]